MIKRNSPEWATFINRLNTIKQKSNREVLCIQCWQMLNCKQKIKHLKQYPDHKAYLLTSTQYASEQKICELAQGYDKLIKKSDGEEYLISPFAPVNLPLPNEHGQNMGPIGLQQVAINQNNGVENGVVNTAMSSNGGGHPMMSNNLQLGDRTVSRHPQDRSQDESNSSLQIASREPAVNLIRKSQPSASPIPNQQSQVYNNLATLLQKSQHQYPPSTGQPQPQPDHSPAASAHLSNINKLAQLENSRAPLLYNGALLFQKQMQQQQQAAQDLVGHQEAQQYLKMQQQQIQQEREQQSTVSQQFNQNINQGPLTVNRQSSLLQQQLQLINQQTVQSKRSFQQMTMDNASVQQPQERQQLKNLMDQIESQSAQVAFQNSAQLPIVQQVQLQQAEQEKRFSEKMESVSGLKRQRVDGTPSMHNSNKLYASQHQQVDPAMIEFISQKFIPKEKYQNLQTEVTELRQSFIEMTKKVDAIIRILEFTINQTLQSPDEQDSNQPVNNQGVGQQNQNLNQLKKMLSQQLNVDSPSQNSQMENKKNLQRLTAQSLQEVQRKDTQLELLEQLANQEGMYNQCSAKILNVMKEQDNQPAMLDPSRDNQVLNMQTEIQRGNQYMSQNNSTSIALQQMQAQNQQQVPQQNPGATSQYLSQLSSSLQQQIQQLAQGAKQSQQPSSNSPHVLVKPQVKYGTSQQNQMAQGPPQDSWAASAAQPQNQWTTTSTAQAMTQNQPSLGQLEQQTSTKNMLERGLMNGGMPINRDSLQQLMKQQQSQQQSPQKVQESSGQPKDQNQIIQKLIDSLNTNSKDPAEIERNLAAANILEMYLMQSHSAEPKQQQPQPQLQPQPQQQPQTQPQTQPLPQPLPKEFNLSHLLQNNIHQPSQIQKPQVQQQPSSTIMAPRPTSSTPGMTPQSLLQQILSRRAANNIVKQAGVIEHKQPDRDEREAVEEIPIGTVDGSNPDHNGQVHDKMEPREAYQDFERAEVAENQGVQNITQQEEVKMEEE